MRQAFNGDSGRGERVAFSTRAPGLIVSNDFARHIFGTLPWGDRGCPAVGRTALRSITEFRGRAAEAIFAAADVQGTRLAWRVGIRTTFRFGVTLTSAVGAAECVSKATGSNITAEERATWTGISTYVSWIGQC